jgi:hypothetical protein
MYSHYSRFVSKTIFPVMDYVSIMIIFQKYFVLINKPELKCNGKCHLMKELASEDDKPISSDKSKVQISLLTFLLQSKFFFSLFSKETIKKILVILICIRI